MFDVARALAIVWALVAVLRARTVLGAGVVLVAYLFALEVASGFTIRGQGPQEPMAALVLVFIGPSGMARGPLPPLPLARLVVDWPAAVSLVTGASLILPTWVLTKRAERASPFSDEVGRLDRVTNGLVLVAVFEGFGAALRLLPYLLSRGMD